MKPSRSARAFGARVDGWVTAALGQGAADFPDLLSRLPGVFPADAAKAVRRLTRTNQISAGLKFRLDRHAPRAMSAIASRTLLPPPHPLDFEWRFTTASSEKLLDLAEAYTRPGDEILLFGTPTLALSVIRNPRDRAICFVGEGNSVTRSISALNETAALPISVRTYAPASLAPGGAHAVVLDPPWYLDFIRPMLSAAAYACRLGGIVAISLPPIGARATAEEDRRRVRILAERLSLEEIAASPCDLTYDTPFFEANALAAAGLFGVQPDWRRGDLAIFRKSGRHKSRIVLPGIREPDWHDVSVRRMRLFIRNDQPNLMGAPSLQSLIPGDILPSVSRRDPRRRRARVWTSGNRIFGAGRPDLVLAAARELSGVWPDPAITRDFIDHRDELERLKYALLNLAEVEDQEERIGR